MICRRKHNDSMIIITGSEIDRALENVGIPLGEKRDLSKELILQSIPLEVGRQEEQLNNYLHVLATRCANGTFEKE